jgi:phosphoribosylformimino-5-aminoimidazole carboxamide ribotide isomerase
MRDDFVIYPAIDLRRGGAVRLRHGSAAEEKRYSEKPTSVARAFAEAGARALHVVDLDGAFEGKPRHFAEVVRIARVAAVPVRFGGGLRTEDDLASAFAAGVAVAIVGTVAIRDPELLAGWIARFGPRLAVSLDVRDGMVRTHGWTESTGVAFESVARALGKTGLTDLIVTDVARDGELSGPNPRFLARAAEAFGAPVVAAGGIGSEADLESLAEEASVRGAIVGRAFYEGTIPLAVLKRPPVPERE